MSDPRATDVLANERTFLAYARTALAFIAFGFVIARFAVFTREAAAIAHIKAPPPGFSSAFGVAMALAGAVCGVYGGYRYVTAARALRRGEVAALPDGAATTASIAIVVVAVVVAGAIFAVR